MALLQTRKLDKWFGGLHVTQEIDFNVKEAEIHCLVGPNGAGKSTFFHLLLGTIQASRGAILFEGRDITHRPSWQRIRDGISVKFQVPGIFQNMSVRQNVQLALQRRTPDLRARNAQTDEILEFLHLHAHSTQLAGNLSHGQKQWLEIGMAISLQPKLLLLDEPTAGAHGAGLESPGHGRSRGRARHEFRAPGSTTRHGTQPRADFRQRFDGRHRSRRTRGRNLSREGI